MLYGNSNAAFIRPALICAAHFKHLVRIAAIGAYVNDRAAPVQVRVAYRSKGKIAAHGRGFTAGNKPQAVGIIRLVRGSHGHLLTEQRTVLKKTGGAEFQIGGAQQGDAAVFLHKVKGRPYFPGRTGFKQHAPDMPAQQFMTQIPLVRGKSNGAEKLPDFFILRQICQCVRYPLFPRLIQKKRRGSQIDLHFRSSRKAETARPAAAVSACL